ncbi:monocarboxylate transporter 5-like [Anneissia japonica]|uniref:monocarboxylate transporter 5-like n=1 Tax=Anneissia japonica TaxID=1529436 RepID=UPI001425689C|nr:monocarboxylate transporter 5-like [Anneissia japonica]
MASSLCIRIHNKQGWMIATSVFVLNFFVFGFVHSYGIILVELQRDFNTSVTKVGSIGSIASATISFMTPISCLLYELTTHRIVSVIGVFLCSLGVLLSSFATDIRLLIPTFSFIFGSGANFLYNPLFNLLSLYFPDKQSTRVTSFGASGATLGSLVLSPLMVLLLSKLEWRTIFQGYSGIILFIGLASCIPLYPPPQACTSSTEPTQNEITNTDQRSDNRCNAFMKYMRILKTMEFWFFILGIFCGSSAVFFYLFYLVSLMESFNISSDKASNQLVISSATQLVGRLFCILFGDRLPISRLLALALNGFIGASITILLHFSINYAYLVVFTAVTGVVIGVHFSLIYSAGIELFGLERNSESLAYTIISIGVATISMPFMYGIWYDTTGSYKISILTSMAVWTLSAIFLILAVICKRYYLTVDRGLTSGVSCKAVPAIQDSSLHEIQLEEKQE